MKSKLYELAGEIKTWIDGQAYEKSFETIIRWGPRFDREKIHTLVVYVVPVLRQSARRARGRYERELTVYVNVLQPCDFEQVVATDEPYRLVDAIEDRLWDSDYMAEARLTNVDTAINQESLWDTRLFEALLTTTWTTIE